MLLTVHKQSMKKKTTTTKHLVKKYFLTWAQVDANALHTVSRCRKSKLESKEGREKGVPCSIHTYISHL